MALSFVLVLHGPTPRRWGPNRCVGGAVCGKLESAQPRARSVRGRAVEAGELRLDEKADFIIAVLRRSPRKSKSGSLDKQSKIRTNDRSALIGRIDVSAYDFADLWKRRHRDLAQKQDSCNAMRANRRATSRASQATKKRKTPNEIRTPAAGSFAEMGLLC